MTSIVLGATGHIGSVCAQTLLEHGETVIAVVHSADKATDLRKAGAEIVVADVHDVAALAAVLERGERAFLLNPPADPAGDTNAEELSTVAAIAEAAGRASLRKIVAASVIGARAGDAIGDLSVLHDFEQRLGRLGVPLAIDRAGYYFSNWDMHRASARDDGVIRVAFPADLEIVMVAPEDLGRVAAERLLAAEDTGIRNIEGPRRYRVQEVADIFARLLNRPVRIDTVPPERIEEMFKDLGFSPPSARAYARMTNVVLEGPIEPDNPIRGQIDLETYLTELVGRS